MYPCPDPRRCTGATNHRSASACLVSQSRQGSGARQTLTITLPASAGSRSSNPIIDKLRAHGVAIPGEGGEQERRENEARQEKQDKKQKAIQWTQDNTGMVGGLVHNLSDDERIGLIDKVMITDGENPTIIAYCGSMYNEIDFRKHLEFQGLGQIQDPEETDFGIDGVVFNGPELKDEAVLRETAEKVVFASKAWNHRYKANLSDKWESDIGGKMVLQPPTEEGLIRYKFEPDDDLELSISHVEVRDLGNDRGGQGVTSYNHFGAIHDIRTSNSFRHASEVLGRMFRNAGRDNVMQKAMGEYLGRLEQNLDPEVDEIRPYAFNPRTRRIAWIRTKNGADSETDNAQVGDIYVQALRLRRDDGPQYGLDASPERALRESDPDAWKAKVDSSDSPWITITDANSKTDWEPWDLSYEYDPDDYDLDD